MAKSWLQERAAVGSGLLAVVSYPAVLVNAGHGQNGFLTAALMGTGALLHERRPWTAGVLFGLMAIKPHLAILVPVFLILAGNWRSFLAAALTLLAICVTSFAVFGVEAWHAFADSTAAARAVLDHDLVGFAKMQSAFAAMRLLGAGNGIAWATQMAFGVVAVAALWFVRRTGAGSANGAAFCCAALMATPFLLDYDLCLLIVPLIWIWASGVRNGFLPWEKTILLAAYLLPLIARPLATFAHTPVAALVVVGVLACIVRRARIEARLSSHDYSYG